jgi:hypothetical protein
MSLNYTRRDTDDGAMFLIGGVDAETVQRAKATEKNTDTPIPNADERPGEAGGPITRFSDVFSPLSLGELETIALSGFEYAENVKTRREELFRNEFPVWKSRFTKTCTECPAEFDEAVDECEACGAPTRDPDPQEKRRAERLSKSVNKEGQSLRALLKDAEWDQWGAGVPLLVIRYEWQVQEQSTRLAGAGQVRRSDPIELRKGDPKRIVPVVDETRRIGGYWWACPRCRGGPDYEPRESPGACEECEAETREVYFAERGETSHSRRSTSDGYDTYYYKEEILTYPYAFPRLNGLDGLSPVHHVWLKQLLIELMDKYAGAFYDPSSKKLPNQFIILHTTNADYWESKLEEIRESDGKSLYDSPILANEYSPQSASAPEVQVVDAMPDGLLGQNDTLKETLKTDIRRQLGVSNVQDNDLSDAGGLNNEGLQLEVTDRSIASQQHDYVVGVLDTLAKRLGIDDWYPAFLPSSGPDAAELRAHIRAGTEAAEAGLDATFEDEQVDIADGEFDPPAPDVGGMGGVPGAPADDPDPSDPDDLGAPAIGDDAVDENATADFDAKAFVDAALAAEAQFVEGSPLSDVAQKATVFNRDDDVPEMVIDLVKEAIDRGGLYDTFTTLSEAQEDDLAQFFGDVITQPQGWSIRSVSERLESEFNLAEEKADSIARNEIGNLSKNARELAYQETESDDALYKWVGNLDNQTTDACEWLLKQTNPRYGGTPRPLPKLKAMVREANARDDSIDHDARTWSPHIGCRKSYVRAYDSS